MAVRSRGRERTNVIIEVGGYPGKEGVRSRGENRVGVDPGAVEGVDRASNTSNGRGSRTGDLDLRSRPRTGEFTFFRGTSGSSNCFVRFHRPGQKFRRKCFSTPCRFNSAPFVDTPLGKVSISRGRSLWNRQTSPREVKKSIRFKHQWP